MNQFFVEELRAKCLEIDAANEELPEEVEKVTEAYERILRFADIGRREGLLALEDTREELDRKDGTQELFYRLIKLVVEGIEPNLVRTIGINKCISTNLPAYRGLMNLMYVQGSLMIQGGDNNWVISEMLESMMPRKILDILHKKKQDIS